MIRLVSGSRLSLYCVVLPSKKKGLAMYSCRSLYLIAAAGVVLASVAATPREKTSKDEAPPAEKLGPEHKELARLAGEYSTVAKFYVKPDDKPMVSKGTAKITSVLDGRFLLEENTGTQFGKPFRGLRLIGYNSSTKHYEASWTYSKSNAIMTMTGTSKGKGKPIEWVASFMDEQGGKQTLYVITRTIDADQFVVEIFGKTKDGKKGPTLETTYTRKK
jgi:hypothetical protein